MRTISALASILAELGMLIILNFGSINIISNTVIFNFLKFNRSNVHVRLLKLLEVMLGGSA
jgi:hypothetical protein